MALVCQGRNKVGGQGGGRDVDLIPCGFTGRVRQAQTLTGDSGRATRGGTEQTAVTVSGERIRFPWAQKSEQA